MGVQVRESGSGIPHAVEEKFAPSLFAYVVYTTKLIITADQQLLLQVIGVLSLRICANEECFGVQAGNLLNLTMLLLAAANVANGREDGVIWKCLAERELHVHTILRRDQSCVCADYWAQVADDGSITCLADLVGTNNIVELLLRRSFAQATRAVDLIWLPMS